MKIFYATQISNFTIINSEKKFILSTDACMNLCVGIISEILKNYEDFNFLIAVPKISLVNDYSSYFELFDNEFHNRIEFIEFDCPVGPGNTRFHFDYNFWNDQNLKLSACDVMINDQNTLTKNWNMLFSELKLNIPIISTNYFMDTPLSEKVPSKVRYFERQMESFNNSDITAFASKANEKEALDAYDMYFKDRSSLKRTTTWNTGCWAKEVDKYSNETLFDIPTIYFANRITDSANRYNNYHKFAEAIGILSTLTNLPFNAVMFNPTRKCTQEQFDLIKKLSNGKVSVFANDLSWTREDYLKFINKAHISCNLFTNEVFGGLSYAEALIAKNITIVPCINNYKDKIFEFSDRKYPFFCDTFYVDHQLEINVHSLAQIILEALRITTDMLNGNAFVYNQYVEMCRNIGLKGESYEASVEKIMSDIKSLI